MASTLGRLALLAALAAPTAGCGAPTLPFSKQPPNIERIDVRAAGGEVVLAAVARDPRGLPLTYEWSTPERYFDAGLDAHATVGGVGAEARWKPGPVTHVPGFLRVEVRVSNGTWTKVRGLYLVSRGDGTIQPIDLGAREDLAFSPLAGLYGGPRDLYGARPDVPFRGSVPSGDPSLVRVLVPQVEASGAVPVADHGAEEVTAIAGTWRDERRRQFELAQVGRRLSASHDGTTFEGTIDVDDNIRLTATGVDGGERVGELGYKDRRMVILWADGTRWERVD